MEENVKKPLSVARVDFIDAIHNNVKYSGLPLFVIEDILKQVYLDVKQASHEQYLREKQYWEKQLSEEQHHEN